MYWACALLGQLNGLLVAASWLVWLRVASSPITMDPVIKGRINYFCAC